MAEAIAVVGTISSVLQIIEFAAKIVSDTHKLVTDEGLRDYRQVENVADKYETLGYISVQGSVDGQTQEEKNVAELGEICKKEARSLLKELESLKLDPEVKGIKRLVDGTRKAGRALIKRKDFEKSRRQLEERNGQLATSMLQLLIAGQKRYSEPILKAVEAATTRIGDDLQKVLIFNRMLQTTDKILASLHFPEIVSREHSIGEAYPATYEWALDDEQSQLKQWLRSEDGIFWVTGKAGSGKSTLMKFLCQQDKTQRLLADWCQGHPLLFASFYFWYSGSQLQKSTYGLLRTILYQILRASPELAQIAFPQHFEKITPEPGARVVEITWTYTQLADGLKAVASSGVRTGSLRKFCFFIDGLDEYHGDQMELVCLLSELVRNKDIKLCVASRPWNVFRDAYEDRIPLLRLHDLSEPDIRRYVNGCIQKALDSCPVSRYHQSRHDVELLKNEIVNKAEGVFLSIVRGFAEGDTVRMLRYRVRHFPADLEKFFHDMLGRVDPVYKVHTSQALKLACVLAHTSDLPKSLPPSFIDFWLIRQNELGLADAQLIYDLRSKVVSAVEWASMVEETQTMLSAACKDLLSLPTPRQEGSEAKVEFLHRTVYDFLMTDGMQATLMEQTPAWFDSSRLFHFLSLARLKVISPNACGSQLFKHSATMFVDAPSAFFDEAYVAAFEDAMLYFLPRFDAWELDTVAIGTVGQDLMLTLATYERHAYLFRLLDYYRYERTETKVTTSFTYRIGLAFLDFTFTEANQRNDTGLQNVSLDLLNKLAEVGLPLLDATYKYISNTSSKHEYDCSCLCNIWQLFLHRWTLSGYGGRSPNDIEPSNSPCLRRIWEVAQAMLVYGCSVEETYQSGPLHSSGSCHQHELRKARSLLKERVPSAWLGTCRHTRDLVEDCVTIDGEEAVLTMMGSKRPSPSQTDARPYERPSALLTDNCLDGKRRKERTK